jgi:nucleoside-diphosphate-sugar epimerase
MKVLVAGGTGLLGEEIVRALVRDGHTVTVMSRSAPSKDLFEGRVAGVRGDVTDVSSLREPLQGQEVVVDAVQFPNSPIENPKKGFTFERIDLGGTKNLVDAAREAGVRHFIGLSGVGARQDAAYHWLRFKWQEEEHIKASGVPFTVFRPSWIYGPRDVSLNRFLGFARFLPFVPVVGDGKNRINPLFIADLGVHVSAAIGREEAIGQVFEIGGPQVMTMDEVIRTALKVSGKRRPLIHQPKGLMKAVAAVIQHAPTRPLTPGAVDFITLDGIADTGRLEEVFGFQLTPLEEGLKTYL